MADAPFTQVVTRSQNVSSTAVALSGVTHFELVSKKINMAWITSDGSVRYKWDGVSPTTTVGHILPANTPLQLLGRQKLLAFRFIGAAGAAAIVTFTLDNTANAGGMQ